jgi:hypothetical protein
MNLEYSVTSTTACENLRFTCIANNHFNIPDSILLKGILGDFGILGAELKCSYMSINTNSVRPSHAGEPNKTSNFQN